MSINLFLILTSDSDRSDILIPGSGAWLSSQLSVCAAILRAVQSLMGSILFSQQNLIAFSSSFWEHVTDPTSASTRYQLTERVMKWRSLIFHHQIPDSLNSTPVTQKKIYNRFKCSKCCFSIGVQNLLYVYTCIRCVYGLHSRKSKGKNVKLSLCLIN
jgi:hypothetical protein